MLGGNLLAKKVRDREVTTIGRDTKGLIVKFRDDATMRKYSRLQLGFIGKQKVRLDAYHQGTAQKFFMSDVGSYGGKER